MTGTPARGGGDDRGEGFPGDTTVRRPRVPTRPARADAAGRDQTGDTVVARRGARGRGPASAAAPGEVPLGVRPGDRESTTARSVAGIPTAYESRAATPVRGSRKAPAPLSTRDDPSVASTGRIDSAVPDATRIRRSVRARARRRLAVVIATIAGLVLVLLGALAVLLFAVGV